MADPILKWAGGKRQLFDEITSRFPDTYGTYYEPFVGGGAIFFGLSPNDAYIGDTNRRLINFYKVVREAPEELIDKLRQFRDPDADPDPRKKFSETDQRGKEIDQYYYQQRARFNQRPYGDYLFPETEADFMLEAALLLYLNRTCYNGLYRENQDGGFNVPIGRYADPDWVQADRIREASRLLDNAQIRRNDFANVIIHADENDLVYFDPPYEPMSADGNFTDYNADGFNQSDQVHLLIVAEKLNEKGVHVVCSNSGVMADKYEDIGFDVDVVGANRSINSDETSRGEVDEIIATNVPQ